MLEEQLAEYNQVTREKEAAEAQARELAARRQSLARDILQAHGKGPYLVEGQRVELRRNSHGYCFMRVSA